MKICVHGVGYVGLATASLFANNGHDVVGYDPDPAVVECFRARDLQTTEPMFEAYVLDALDAGLTASTEPVKADCHIICVPTPYDWQAGHADLTHVKAAGEAIADLLHPGDMVILESTVPPETTTDILAPLLVASGTTHRENFSLAYCPETILPGNTAHELVHNDRIIGGVDAESTDRAAALFGACVDGAIHRAPDSTTAEFVKLAQNAYRDVNIAFANELAKLAADYGVRSREAITLANTHPRVDVLNPGLGVGGHCLPVDPLFLGHSSDELELLSTARRVNDGMVKFVIDLIDGKLDGLGGSRISVLGVAYKPDVADTRYSPGLRLADALATVHEDGAPTRWVTTTDGGPTYEADTPVEMRLHDPHAEDDRLLSLSDALSGADAVIVATGHSAYRDIDPGWVADMVDSRVVVDGPAVLDGEAWREAGFEYIEI